MRPSPPPCSNRLARPLLGLICLLCLVSAACLSSRPFDEQAWQEEVARTDPALLRAPHYEPREERYFNPWLPQEKSDWNALYWFLSRNSLDPPPGADPPVPVEANDGAYFSDPGSPPSLTWAGHATFVVQWGGQVVVTDPFFGGRALLPARRVPPPFGAEVFPEGTVALISHNHYDHLDAASVAALGDRALFLCPLGLGGPLREMGARRVVEMDWWESREIGGTTFTCLPAQHWSRRIGQGYNTTLWCSFMLSRGGVEVYYAADSGYFKGFKEIGRLWPDIEAVLMPVGAYLPRWFMHYAHMDIPEALRALRDLGAGVMVPTQWGVLKLGDEPASYPVHELELAMEKDPELSQRVKILPVGGRMMLPGPGGGSERSN